MMLFRIFMLLSALFFGVASIGVLSDAGRDPEHLAAFYCFVISLFTTYWAYRGPK